ncbi:KinB-signaling pathway activation protein [Alkalihalobacillus pseudalcaliphilus]|uniref:KinB-signaling pathway activation protein n=1 Tax=Alkalihalobacillus pseudalcaliphilus TaxID=79884 RepID=UPI00064DCE72|nr:KinB-signaling pathway activation protein [Alkalihalobacillus pseudalcaliphilus]KMK74910.1 KinB activator protein [Alkalihalobacillus pseudalcaliphilus]
MNSRKVVFLFISTLLVGSISGTIVGIFIRSEILFGEGFANLFFGLVWIFGISAAFALIAQMGFFAYLTIHRFGLGIFKSAKLWNAAQVVIIAFVLFDLVYFRYIAFAEANETIFHYMVMPLAFLLYAMFIAYLKAKDTNKATFIPALFFMYVVTTIEWVPALLNNDSQWLWLYLTPLISANTWQLLILHRLQNKDDGKSKVGNPNSKVEAGHIRTAKKKNKKGQAKK